VKGKLERLKGMIEEAERLVEKIYAESDGLPVVERNAERMRACVRMMRLGVVEPLEIEG
jgi:hypothetical protein